MDDGRVSNDNYLPCPFCGAKPIVAEGYDEENRIIWCRTPDCVIFDEHLFYSEDAHAIAAWNRRAEPEPAPRLDAFKNKVAEHELRLDALAERVATLEQVAGYGPRAGEGFRVQVERGEPSEG